MKQKNKTTLWTSTNTETGKTIDIVTYGDETIGSVKKTYNRTPKQISFLNKQNELKSICNELGGYIHMFYIKNELLFNDIGLNPPTVARVVYLATYIDYNNRESNLLVKYGKHNKIEAMSKKDIKNIMKLNNETFKKFFKEIKDKNILIEFNNKFYINDIYFTKGTTKCTEDESRINKDYTRVFIDTVRDIYLGSQTKQHKYLGYVFQIIPWINYNRNIVCYNPEERNFEHIKLMGLKDICNLLGINSDGGNAKKIERQLLNIKVTISGKEYHMFRRIVNIGATENTTFDYFVVNPAIVWRGNEIDEFKDSLKGLSFRHDYINN